MEKYCKLSSSTIIRHAWQGDLVIIEKANNMAFGEKHVMEIVQVVPLGQKD
jgi:hypothetical protein